MEFRFIGTGGAFDFEYGNSAAWIQFRGKNILLDCGHAAYRRLREIGIAGKIDYMLITHFHDDHIGSLSTAILHQKHLRKPPEKVQILIPPGPVGAQFQDQLYAFLAHSLIQPEKYLDFVPLDTLDGIHAIDTSGKHVKDMLSFGFAFEDEQENVLFSGDLGDPGLIFRYAESLPQNKKIRIFHEVSFWRTDGVHSFYKDLEKYVNKWEFYGYHCNPTYAPEDSIIPLVANHPEFLFL